MARTRFEIHEDHGWRWQLIDANNELIANSEPYDSKSNARRGAENVKTSAPQAEIVER